ncbi:carnitine O-palmitoyltransferase 2, mitochondrial [Condylostylus longicornis]|uniref:carnitine O-palmitoyltransferase 2, mitochondrial n=1 Tax=Condylostylus longicornis TaxID=2530218 RepID=UPI00244DB4C8|nr:carnitine O-palmitoyltransferase 2, mitochondrial [Condylostylus longicornis]XP_055384742.1 carnitine O-palmitoyltransferase 2, mitochondrial [Condylostylus longicornis]
MKCFHHFKFHSKFCSRPHLYLNNKYSTRTREHCNPEYQFLQNSMLPSMYFQPSLPRLPIPTIEKTCERYLKSVKPLLIDEGYRKTQDVVEKFKISSGPQLQKILKDRDSKNKHTSYISEPWFDMYLRDRRSLPINYNPLIVMKQDTRPEYNNILIRAANIVVSTLRFYKSLMQENLEPEIFHLNPKKSDTDLFRKITKIAPVSIATYVAYAFKAFPLDMSQYKGMFNATRIPELDKDRIFVSPTPSRHILVMLNGNFYAVDVIDEDGNIESPNVILGRIKQVLRSKNILQPDYPIGILTAGNRDKWAMLRYHLTKISSKNENSMKLIDSALFCLCLDVNTKYDHNDPIPLVKHYLVGDGINRWFDKSFSVFVGKDGISAVNFEHSWGDGVCILRYFNEIYKEITESPFVHPNTTAHLNDSEQKSIRSLEFDLDDQIKKGVEETRNSLNNVVSSLNIAFTRNPHINKKLCKANNVSPDAIIQLAFQLAYRQLFGKYVGTYESCSTAAFRHGRTETMRPCTIETKNFCDSIVGTKPNERLSNNELRLLIQKCSQKHNELTKEAAMGQGFDRHLFGLKHVAELHDMKIPNLYQDSAYQIMNYNIISTSTLGSPALLAGSFGPVVEDGLGIGYSIQNDECGAVVTSYEGQRDGKAFVDSLNDAFKKIQIILETK